MLNSNNKKIIAAAICILLLNTSAYAGENNNYTKLKAEIKTIQKENKGQINENYINKIAALYFLQMKNGEFKEAEKTINNYMQLNKDFYGADSVNTAFAYLLKANFYIELKLYESAIENIKEADRISKENPANHILEYDILTAKIQYFQNIDQPYEAIALLNTKKELALKHGLYIGDSDLNYARAYIQIKDLKKASDYLNRYYKTISNIADNKEKALLEYYLSNANLYMNKIDYKNVLKYSLKAKELNDKLNKNDSTSLINNYNDLVLYYVEMLDYKTVREYIDKLLELNKESYSLSTAENLYDKYIDISKETNDFKGMEKYLNKKKSIINHYPKSSFKYLDLYEKSIELYNEIHDYDTSEELARQALNIIEPSKDKFPAIYAKYLLKMSEIQDKKKETRTAIEYLKAAEQNYIKVLPSNAYQYYEINKNLADIYKHIGDNGNALKYYRKALVINKTLQGDKHREIADIYESYAEIYSQQNKKEKALKYIDETIEIYKNIYGENHVKTVKKLLAKHNVYNNLNLEKEASELISALADDAENGRIIGDNKNVYFDIYSRYAYKYLCENDSDNAVLYAKKALKSAAYDAKKKEAYTIFAHIYEAKGNKLMQYKYNHLAN